MVEVLNSEKGGSEVEDLDSIKTDIKKLKSDIKNCDKRTEDAKVSSTFEMKKIIEKFF